MNRAVRLGAAVALLALATGAVPRAAMARLHPANSKAATGRAECRFAPSKILGHPVAYCVILPPSYDISPNRRYPVLYFLHGLGENEQVLAQAGGMDLIEDLWQQKKLGEFLIVTPAAGRSFYVNSLDGRVRYQDFFIREFMPFIEKHYRARGGRESRGIGGVSMGGYGALRFAFLDPQLFGSVSAHSAALVGEQRTANMQPAAAMELSQLLGPAFGTPFNASFWNRNSPFTIVRDRPRPAGLKIYFDCGSEDDYGFNRGAEAFDKLLTRRAIPHEFHLYPGGHDWAYVAQHFAASLEFHWRAFSGGPRSVYKKSFRAFRFLLEELGQQAGEIAAPDGPPVRTGRIVPLHVDALRFQPIANILVGLQQTVVGAAGYPKDVELGVDCRPILGKS